LGELCGAIPRLSHPINEIKSQQASLLSTRSKGYEAYPICVLALLSPRQGFDNIYDDVENNKKIARFFLDLQKFFISCGTEVPCQDKKVLSLLLYSSECFFRPSGSLWKMYYEPNNYTCSKVGFASLQWFQYLKHKLQGVDKGAYSPSLLETFFIVENEDGTKKIDWQYVDDLGSITDFFRANFTQLLVLESSKMLVLESPEKNMLLFLCEVFEYMRIKANSLDERIDFPYRGLSFLYEILDVYLRDNLGFGIPLNHQKSFFSNIQAVLTLGS